MITIIMIVIRRSVQAMVQNSETVIIQANPKYRICLAQLRVSFNHGDGSKGRCIDCGEAGRRAAIALLWQ